MRKKLRMPNHYNWQHMHRDIKDCIDKIEYDKSIYEVSLVLEQQDKQERLDYIAQRETSPIFREKKLGRVTFNVHRANNTLYYSLTTEYVDTEKSIFPELEESHNGLADIMYFLGTQRDELIYVEDENPKLIRTYETTTMEEYEDELRADAYMDYDAGWDLAEICGGVEFLSDSEKDACGY